jgi:hypothetical protein
MASLVVCFMTDMNAPQTLLHGSPVAPMVKPFSPLRFVTAKMGAVNGTASHSDGNTSRRSNALVFIVVGQTQYSQA